MSKTLAQIRNLLIDMDGVLYRGQSALEGAAEFMAFVQERELGYLLVTNNSTLTPEEFHVRLAGMGMDVPPERIMTSGVATAAYLATQAPPGTRVNVVGEPALVRELEKRGFVMGGRESEYVVAGWDKTLTFEKLKVATLAIRDGATFIGTNPDKTYPLENDIIPGAGCMLAALVAATDVEPLVVGKPETLALELALEFLDASPEETAILGDRLETDILGGQRTGLKTIMVLTGISTAEEAAAYPTPPDWVFADLVALQAAWQAALAS